MSKTSAIYSRQITQRWERCLRHQDRYAVGFAHMLSYGVSPFSCSFLLCISLNNIVLSRYTILLEIIWEYRMTALRWVVIWSVFKGKTALFSFSKRSPNFEVHGGRSRSRILSAFAPFISRRNSWKKNRMSCIQMGQFDPASATS